MDVGRYSRISIAGSAIQCSLIALVCLLADRGLQWRPCLVYPSFVFPFFVFFWLCVLGLFDHCLACLSLLIVVLVVFGVGYFFARSGSVLAAVVWDSLPPILAVSLFLFSVGSSFVAQCPFACVLLVVLFSLFVAHCSRLG